MRRVFAKNLFKGQWQHAELPEQQAEGQEYTGTDNEDQHIWAPDPATDGFHDAL